MQHRLINQRISVDPFDDPANVVKWLGALQAQDFPGAKWSIGLRMGSAVESDIDRAISERTIVRTWPMRGTLHFVPAADIHWMLKLLAAKPIATAAARRQMLGLTADDFIRSEAAFIDLLSGGRQATRDSMYAAMDNAGVSSSGQRGIHVIRHLAMEGLLCFGSHEGKQPSFALLDEWCPEFQKLDKEESLAELAKRYFLSHGPAGLDDFVRWSGLTVGEARRGIESSSSSLSKTVVEGRTYWLPKEPPCSAESADNAFVLPGFDEYLLGYKDRSAALPNEYAEAICPGGNGMFVSTIVINGMVVGTWSRIARAKHVVIKLQPFVPLTASEKELVDRSAEKYGTFIGQEVRVA